MVALSSKTYHCMNDNSNPDSLKKNKLSSKGLQKRENTQALSYEAFRQVLETTRSSGGTNTA